MATLGYFRSDKIPIAPYTVHSPEEIIVHVAAHELAHCMRRGQKFRKSRIEVFCENRATEVLAAFRTPEGQAWIAAERVRMASGLPEPELVDEASEKCAKAVAELAKVEAGIKRWTTKAKRAANALKKLNAKRKRLVKKLEGAK